MYPALEKFTYDIQQIDEDDYGDFMRKANHYLLELREEMRSLPFDDVQNYINLMQVYIQFSSNWSVEPTRSRAIRDAKFINELLLGHQQDWES